MKQRFSSLDIRVIAHELSQTLVSCRVSNIYDLSSRVFLIKFARPEHREQLVIDAGFRCHTSQYSRATTGSPSAFVSRLRKVLNNRRVTRVEQIGTDRILELQFSDGEYRLYLEFYAAGNIVLTDKDLSILALQRIVNDGAPHERIRVGSAYNLSERQNVNGAPTTDVARVRRGMQTWVERQEAATKKVKGDELRKALASFVNEFPPTLLDHSLKTTGADTSQTPAAILQSDDKLAEVVTALEEAKRVVDNLLAAQVVKGYIFKTKDQWTEYHPFKPKHFIEDAATEIVEFDGFNNAVDQFYSSIESQRVESRLKDKETAAQRRLEKVKLDQQQRIGGLQAVEALNIRKAQAIEANLERVEEAMGAINSLIGQGRDWGDIDKLVELEQQRGNPIAAVIILPLKLQENTATLALFEEAEDSDEEDEAREPVKVDVDLGVSAWVNARSYYDQKRTAAAKTEKTSQASEMALKNQQRKIEADLKQAMKQEKEVLYTKRTQLWFEKFVYFLSSDGYLILGGKDAQQADRIHTRLSKKGDVFVHADRDGAVALLIKNPSGQELPPSTLAQAGTLSVATSKAWDSKAVMSAWWVPAEHVRKIAPTGDFLAPGSFHIDATKNFLPPTSLLLGFAVLFRISEASKSNHSQRGGTIAGGTAFNENKSISAIESSTESAEGTHGEESDASEDGHRSEDEPGTQGDSVDENLSQDKSPDQDADNIEASAQDKNESGDGAFELIAQERVPDEDAEDEDVDESIEDTQLSAKTEFLQLGTREEAKSTPSKTPAPFVSGKHAKKKKKIAAKYADQDDEDRAEAMRLLGATKGKERQEAEAEAKRQKEEQAAKQQELAKAKRLRAIEEGKERERRRLEDAQDDDEADQSADFDLGTLVGTPARGDELLEAIPVCAPWSSLQRYKYAAKLQPGSQKKGKAIREVLSRWLAAATPRNVDANSQDLDRIWPREIELLKGWKEAELFGVVPVSKLQVVMSGGSKKAASGKAEGRKGPAKGR